MVTTIAEMQGILTLDDSQYKSAMQNAAENTRNLGSSIRNAGSQITKFGVGASLALAPVTVFLGSSVNAFREFDVAMTNSQTILGVTNEEMSILSDQVLEMGANTGLGPQAVADSFFTVVSGVQDATTHMDILQSSITLAEAGMADLGVTTDGIVAVMNSYQFAAEDAAFVSDVFTRTVQSGVGTMDEFVGALAPLASLSNQMGIEFEQLAASEAFLTTQGQSAGAAATELQAIMTAFIKPSQGMTDALNALGFESGKAAIEALGFQGAVDALSASLDDDEVALGQVFTRAEALKGAMILAGDGAEEFETKFKEGVDGAAQAAADLQNATDAAIGDAFTSKIDALKIRLGEDISGAIADVQRELLPMIDSFIQWAEANPETVKQALLFAGALVVVAGGLVLVGGLVTALGAVLAALTSPFAAVLLVAAGLAFIIDQVARAFGAEDGLLTVLERAQIGFDVFVAATELVFEGMVVVLTDALVAAGQLFVIFFAGIDDAINITAGLFETIFVGGINFVIDALNVLIEAFNTLSNVVGGPTIDTIKRIGEQSRASAEDVDALRESMFGVKALGFLGLGNSPADSGNSGGVRPFADGGDFAAGQTMMVGERGPEVVQFNQPGTVFPNGQSPGGGGMFAGANITIVANDEAGGRAAARGFKSEFEDDFDSIFVRNG
jgi:TP901 family phage tail tape measure protein